MSLVRQIVIIVVLVGLGAAAWFGFGRDFFSGDEGAAGGATAAGPGRPGGGGPPGGGPGGRGGPGGFGRGATLVVTAPVVVDDRGLDVRAVGTATAVRAITLYAEVSGMVKDVMFVPGTMVVAGEELLRLVDDDEDVALERARLAVETATSALERARRLAESNNITTVALTDAETAVRRAEIDLRQAEVDLARRTVRAPFAGRVGLTEVTVGDLVNSSMPVATLDDMSSVTVSFSVPERATGLVDVGHPITATAEALPGVQFSGAITQVDSRVDGVTRTLRVRATLPNTEARLKPGMALTVLLHFEGERRPLVPSLAIQWDREGPYVWKVVDDKVARAPVDIVDRRAGEVTVVGDLAAGDPVVVEGLQSLRDGATVSIAGSPASPPGDRPERGGAPVAGSGRPGPAAGAQSDGSPGARPAGGPPGSAVAGERRRGPRADGQGRPQGPDAGQGRPQGANAGQEAAAQ